MTKLMLLMKNERSVPFIHSDTLNPIIDFKIAPFFVQKDLTE